MPGQSEILSSRSTKKLIVESVMHASDSREKSKKRIQQSSSNSNRSDSVRTSPNEPKEPTEFHSDLATIFYSKGKDKRPHVTVFVKNQPITALVDTGAQSTAVGRNFLDEIRSWGYVINSCPITLRMADQSELHPFGQADIEYTLDGITRTVTTIIMDKPSNKLILGVNFLAIFGIGVDKILQCIVPIANTSEGVEINEISTLDVSVLDAVKEELAESLIISDETYVPSMVKETVTKPPPVIEDSSGSFKIMTARDFIEWINYEDPNDLTQTIASTESTSIDETKKVPDIFLNKVITADDHTDLELDVDPPKISPVTIPHILTPEQQTLMDAVLGLFVHTNPEGVLNQTTAIEHIIDTGDAKPVMKRQYPMSPIQLEKVQRELDRMAAMGIVAEIKYSPWRSPVIAVSKKDGGVRVCLDARELNKITVPNAFPIMDTNSILAQLKTTRYMSSIDLSQAFHQIPLAKESQEKTSFSIGNRMMCYRRMTMGLRNSPATLAILIDQIFHDLHPYAFAYVDDFVICTETFEHHMQVLTVIANRLKKFGLTISPSKSNFCCQQLEFLGYILSEKGLQANPAKISAIKEFPTPVSVRDVRRFIGAASWYRRFIHKFAELSAPLTALICKNKKTINWSPEAELAFNTLKEKLTTPPILAMCDYNKPFRIFCDASDVAGAAVLTQDFDDGNRPIFYHSFKFSATQQKYCATERECLAVIAAVEKFRPYIEGSKFEVVTDHQALKWLMETKDRKGRLSRWALRLQVYAGDMKTIHRAGKTMELPDALSRVISVIDVDTKTTDTWYTSALEKAKLNDGRYKIENGLLYHRSFFSTYSGERLWALCVPIEKRNEVLIEQHDKYSHMGVWKTTRRIKSLYYWPNMDNYIYEYIRQCDVCRCVKPSNENTKTPMGAYRDPRAVGNVISIDLVGPWPLSKNGNRHILIVVDCFSKYVWAKPLRRASAKQIIKFLVLSVFTTNGVPRILRSDNGPQFIGKEFIELCARLQIDHHRTPRYHPQANPVEATNKTAKTCIRAHLLPYKDHGKWEDHLIPVINHMNSTPHTATGRTPQYVHFGRELIQHGSDYVRIVDVNPERDNDPDRLELIRDEIRQKAADVYEDRRVRYNRGAKKRHFEVGAEVFISNMKLSNKGDGYNRKLAPSKLKARIKEQVGDDTYVVTDLKGKEIGRVHANDIFMHILEHIE